MLIAASCLLLALGVLAYRRQLGRDRSLGLLGLRLAVLAGFGAILVGQVLAVRWAERPRRVVLLADVSASMAQTRQDSAALGAAEAFPLPERARREVWRFADSVGPRPDSSRTRIARALRIAGRTRPAAVVLLSDGQDNGEGDAVGAARRLGVPVYAVGFGPAAERNLAVSDVSVPAEVYEGDTAKVRVRLQGAGLSGERVRVRVAGAEKDAVFGPGIAEQELEFRVGFRPAGRQMVRAQAESLPAERNYADNLQVAPVEVRPARVRVVYLANCPGANTRFLLRALAGVPRAEVVPVVAKVGGFPADRVVAEVRRADVLVLDGVRETGQDASVWSAVAERVRQGAGLALAAGSEFSVGRTLSALVPVEGEVKMQAGTFTPAATGEGALLPWFQAGVGIDLGVVPPFTAAVGGTLRPGARAWLSAMEDGAPLLVAGRAGRGRVVFVAGDPLWRWGFLPTTDSPLEVLVAGLVRFLGESDTVRFRLETDRPAYRAGERIRLRLKARAADGAGWDGLDVFASIGPGTGRVGRVGAGGVAIPFRGVGAGVYEVELDGLNPGSHELAAAARYRGTEAGRAALRIEVAEQSVELAALGMNRPLLEAVARAGGGGFFPQDSLPVGGFELRLGTHQRSILLDPRRMPLIYAGLAVLAGVELVLRRRKGLL